ncbi:MAG TPA: hypothetical protein PKA64_02820 [Myxococcota bacterium]|nr:hypothetical protein [Myxococcota bacterium]
MHFDTIDDAQQALQLGYALYIDARHRDPERPSAWDYDRSLTGRALERAKERALDRATAHGERLHAAYLAFERAVHAEIARMERAVSPRSYRDYAGVPGIEAPRRWFGDARRT